VLNNVNRRTLLIRPWAANNGRPDQRINVQSEKKRRISQASLKNPERRHRGWAKAQRPVNLFALAAGMMTLFRH